MCHYCFILLSLVLFHVLWLHYIYCYILCYNSYMYMTVIAIIPVENHIYNITRLDSDIDFLHVFAHTPMLD